MMIPLGPLFTVAVVIAVSPVVSATQPPVIPVAVQSRVNPKKKKSVPPTPILGLKNSVHPVQRAVVDVRSCWENEAVVFMVVPLNPKEYCHGLVLAGSVPHSRITPVEGAL
jgi:hypothetical protein